MGWKSGGGRFECAHNTLWLLEGGRTEYCWGCGAIRFTNPKTYWCKPVTPDGENPWPPKPFKRTRKTTESPT